MIANPLKFDPPLVILSVMPLALFIFKVAKMVYLYRVRVQANLFQTVASAVAGLSLSHTISKAILLGLCTKGIPFFRTPKMARAHALFHALQSAREEGLVVFALWLADYAIAIRQGADTPDVLVWLMVLLVQSIPYTAAVVMAVISGFAKMPTQIINRITAPPTVSSQAGTSGV